jgi:hypothetical protein
VASEKQIAANRRNAERSTGPRTAAGKSISSHNAFRHGLSLAPDDDASKVQIDQLTQAIIQKEPTLELSDAHEWASAHLELHRIKRVKSALLDNLDLSAIDPMHLKDIVATDRYAARAQTKRRKAAAKLKV